MANVEYKATGRRKSSSARVILTPGSGKITVNGVDVNDYMPYAILVQDIKQPLVLTNNESNFDVVVNVKGGGFSGQAGAIRLGVARAIIAVDASQKSVLKAAGLITRDSRAKERKKYGLKKARKSPQFSKR